MRNQKRSESTEQTRVMNWARRNEYRCPELALLHHIPNGGSRNKIEAANLKAQGVKSGVPDLCLPAPKGEFHGLYIEMKFGKNKTTAAQEEFMALLQAEGHKTAVAYSYEEAREIVRGYLARAEGFDLVNCEEAPKIFNYCEGVGVEWAPCATCQYYKANRKEI